MTAGRALDRYDVLLLDLDGTVYHGSEVVPGAADAVAEAHRAAVRLRYVTNNASKSPQQVADHLTGLGVPASPDEVSTSAQAGAKLLAELVPAGSSVLVVGTESLVAEIRGVGLNPVRDYSEAVSAVVQGHSPTTTWENLAHACRAIRAGARWVACNVDPTLPSEFGELPGNGSMVAALRTATGQHPEVAGKPAPALFRTAMESAQGGHGLVVGDRLDTDIAGANAAGLNALLVLSGVTTAAALIAAVPEERPTHLAWDIRAITDSEDTLRIGPRPGWKIEPIDGSLSVLGTGEQSDELELLRALCAAAWETGETTVHAGDSASEAALSLLALA